MTTDVLVIGGGLAGLRCAEEAAKTCDVTLIADGGGASPYIHGISIPLSPADSAEQFYRDTMESGRMLGREALVRTLCEESLLLPAEFEFDRKDGHYDLLKPLGASVPRVAGIGGRTGATILHDIGTRRRFTQLGHIRAMRLLCRENAVIGAQCFDCVKNRWFTISAKAVVLATGGFGGIFPFSTNSSDIGGDGIAMAYEAGAVLCDMEFIQFEPTAAVYPRQIAGKSIITTMLYEGAVIRNAARARFMEERVNKDELSLGIYREIARGNGTENGGVYYDMTGVDHALLHTRYRDYLERYQRRGIDITKEYAEIAPAPHTTLGGVVIDPLCRTTVNGLFACGEVTGGLHGANRLGGNAGLEVLVFGRIAGKSAAEYAASSGRAEVADTDTADEPFDGDQLRRRLTAAVGEYLNVIRDRSGLETLMDLATDIAAAARSHRNSFSAQRLYNDALTASVAAASALQRRGSIGCHVRRDAVSEDSMYNVLIHRANGAMTVERKNCSHE